MEAEQKKFLSNKIFQLHDILLVTIEFLQYLQGVNKLQPHETSKLYLIATKTGNAAALQELFTILAGRFGFFEALIEACREFEYTRAKEILEDFYNKNPRQNLVEGPPPERPTSGNYVVVPVNDDSFQEPISPTTGTNHDLSNNNEEITLFTASNEEDIDIGIEKIKDLITRRAANPKEKDSNGRTFLHLLFWRKLTTTQFSEVYNCLDHNGHSNLFNEKGGDDLFTPLQLVLENVKLDDITLNNLLANNEIDWKVQDADGNYITAVIIWSKTNTHLFDTVAEHLETTGVDWKNCLDRERNSLVHYAALWGNVEVLSTLLEKWKLNVNVTNIYGNSPIHNAIRAYEPKNGIDIVNLLINHGATSKTKNKYHRTPLDLAKGRSGREGMSEVVNILEKLEKINQSSGPCTLM